MSVCLICGASLAAKGPRAPACVFDGVLWLVSELVMCVCGLKGTPWLVSEIWREDNEFWREDKGVFAPGFVAWCSDGRACMYDCMHVCTSRSCESVRFNMGEIAMCMYE